MSSRIKILTAALVGAIGLCAWGLVGPPHNRTSERPAQFSKLEQDGFPPAATPLAPLVQTAVRSAPRGSDHRQLDEPAIMSRLRAIGQSAPLHTFQLAQQGNAMFPDSADAPERAWFVVRALVNLGRFHAARDEARTMVERYPGTSWTADVERHLLVYPLDHPPREEK